MKKGILIGITTAMILIMSFAVSAAAPNWDITGTWAMDFVLGGDYFHTMTVTLGDFNTFTGAFSGTGFYNPDHSYTWDITGTVSGDDITFHILYTGTNAGYAVDATGTIASDGLSMGGDDATGPGQVFDSWNGIGAALPIVHGCPEGTVTEHVETVTVYPNGNSYVSSSLTNGAIYLIEASGTYRFANWGSDGIADAAYNLRPVVGWVDGSIWAEPYTSWLELWVNNAAVDNWGTFNPSHEYMTAVVGGGTPASFKILDDAYGDNTGSLSADIYYCAPDNDGDDYGSNDCDDTNAAIHPGAADSICDGVDDNCDGTPDDGYVPDNSCFVLSGDCTVGNVASSCSGGVETKCKAYAWTGFFQPVDNLPTLNVVKAGSAIPVKFNLNCNMGLSIFATDPISTKINCVSTASEDTVETTVTAGGSSLNYDPIANQYIYVWKTDKTWAGKCRQLTVTLADGTTHIANFKFK